MHANAKYVSEGALGYIHAEDYYKQVRGLPISDLSAVAIRWDWNFIKTDF
jgi:hypothetical protein